MDIRKLKKSMALRVFLDFVSIILTISIILTACYGIVVWGNIPYITALRDVWIETAMTTFEHKWLATGLFPKWLIDEVTGEKIEPSDDISITDNIVTPPPETDILGQKQLTVGQKDSLGNKVIVNNIEQGIVIVEIRRFSFLGRLVLIDDSSRVFVGTTSKKGVQGEFVCDLMDRYDAIVGVNGSGFADAGGHGKGGVIMGMCYSQGEKWGNNDGGTAVGFDTNNRLVVGKLKDWESYNIRDGIQFSHPTLISEGEQKIKTSAGYGMQPRTIIAQRADGVAMFLVCDGRSATSLGARLGECAEVLMEYGAVNAGACDGGSSSVLGYDGKVINVPSTPMKTTGRYLPNAFLVRKK